MATKKKQKKCYTVHYEEWCHAVVAETRGRARMLYCQEYELDFIDSEIKVRVHNNLDISQFEIGLIRDPFWCLKNKLYSHIEDKCPSCGDYADYIEYDSEKKAFYCEECGDEKC